MNRREWLRCRKTLVATLEWPRVAWTRWIGAPRGCAFAEKLVIQPAAEHSSLVYSGGVQMLTVTPRNPATIQVGNRIAGRHARSGIILSRGS